MFKIVLIHSTQTEEKARQAKRQLEFMAECPPVELYNRDTHLVAQVLLKTVKSKYKIEDSSDPVMLIMKENFQIVNAYAELSSHTLHEAANFAALA